MSPAASGKLLVDFPGSCAGWSAPCAATFQRDGKIVVVGTDRDPWPPAHDATRFALARYLPSGRVDRRFGRGGKALTSFGLKWHATASAVIVQLDGRIVVAGSALDLQHRRRVEEERGGGERPVSRIALARYLPDGRLDPDFGRGGKVLTGGGAGAAVALQDDGKIVVAGIGLVRYTPQGRLDRSFGDRGKVVTPSDLAVRRVVMQSGGRVLVAGEATDAEGAEFFGLVRYTADGSIDRSFGDRGSVRTGLAKGGGSSLYALAVQEDGNIVAAGYGETGNWGTFALARYDDDGTLDDGFGSRGEVVTPLGSIFGMKEAEAIAIQQDGKILAGGGYVDEQCESTPCLALLRYRPSGRLDDGFGSGGKVLSALPSREPGAASALALTVWADGRIVLVGSIGDRVALARYLGDGRADPSFGD